jgi:parallel beta-helix repeat protein
LAGSSSGPDIGVFGDSLREYLFDTQNSVMPAILMVDTGVHTLADLVKVASEMGTPGIVAEGDAYRISVPIFVRQGATLILSGLEAGEYRLDTHSGAFIMNAGTLVVTDTSLLAYDYRKGTPDVRTAEQQGSFRPFVTSWSGSRTEIANAELKNLGYFGGRSYGFTMASDPAYLLNINPDSKKPTGTIVDSTFENLVYGFYSYEAENVLLIGNEYRDNIIYGLDPHDRSNHLVLAYNTAYGSIKKHGGIISREVDDGLIVGNLTFANKGAGLMVERNSVGNVVYANTSFANGGDGISIYESPCNLVESNLSFSNGNAGIKIRNSWSVLVRANQLSHNKGAGLEAAIADVTGLKDAKERDLERDPFYTYSELDARLNEIEGNGSGILAKGASHITLDSNVFRSQTPDTFSGDLKAYRAQLVRPGLGLVHATTSSCIPARPLANKCPLEDLWSSGQQYTQRVTTNGSPSNDCTDQIGSIQERALNATQAELQSK